jgi:hypothetical protein
MLLRIPWSFLGILNYGAFAKLGVRAQQCIGRSLVKVGGTYFARAIRQYRTKPLKLGEGARLDGEHPSWMKVQSDSHRKVSQIV